MSKRTAELTFQSRIEVMYLLCVLFGGDAEKFICLQFTSALGFDK